MRDDADRLNEIAFFFEQGGCIQTDDARWMIERLRQTIVTPPDEWIPVPGQRLRTLAHYNPRQRRIRVQRRWHGVQVEDEAPLPGS